MFKLIILLGFLCTENLQITATPIHPNGIYGDKFQGDIKLTEIQKKFLFGNGNDDNVKTGWTWEGFRWPTNADGFVTVPYRINPSGGFLPNEINWMLSEFRVIESKTCIRFVERTTEEDFVEVINGDGCWSWLGRIGGRQELSISRSIGCVSQGIMVHEAIHALGYDHMHNHIDRDLYVSVIWDNIQPEFHFAFDKVDPQWFDNFGTPYDLMSVMHYPRWAFSRNGGDTVVPHNREYIDRIGSVYISDDDVLRLNRMYRCPI